MSNGEARKLASTTDYAANATLCKCARQRPLTPTAVALPILRAFLRDDTWRKVLTQATSRPFAIIFPDARGRSSISTGHLQLERLVAVLITATGGRYTILDASTPDAVPWLKGTNSEHRINECESFAALLVLHSSAPLSHDAEVVHFVESSAAEGSLIKGYSCSATLAAVAGAYWTTAGRCNAAAWIGRVPSRLNVADGPTRGDLSAIETFDWQHTLPTLPPAKPWQVLLQGKV